MLQILIVTKTVTKSPFLSNMHFTLSKQVFAAAISIFALHIKYWQ